MTPTATRVVLGDWTALVRDWADVVRLSYLGGAAYCFLRGWDGHGARMLVTFVVVLAPRWLNTPRPFDLLFCLSIGLQAWGNAFGAFHNGNLFDRVDHAFSSFGVAPLFYLWFVHVGLLDHPEERPPASHQVGLVVIGFCIGLSIGALYEIYEFASVHIAGTGNYVAESDTVWDLAMDAIGSAAGSLLLLTWVVGGWGTKRAGPTERQPAGARLR
ncbi:MAG TPA: hypothetical protein VFJ98_05340 [Mycobacteriales bacterium]|nr:hypothetical protein [Mycobacteriales bacterium]